MRQRIPRVIAYLRVSTQRQDLDNQRLEIEKYAAGKGLEVDQWITVKMTSRNGHKERKIDELMLELKTGDILIVTELSRLARSMRDCFNITGELFKKKIETHVIKQGLVLRENDMSSKVMISAFSMAAEIERDLISARTKNGLDLARERGVKLGNPNLVRDTIMRKANAEKFAKSLQGIIEGFKAKGMSQRQMVNAMNEAGIKTRQGKTWQLLTLQRVLKRLGI